MERNSFLLPLQVKMGNLPPFLSGQGWGVRGSSTNHVSIGLRGA
jgi:hypothetical protein